ncbi:phosphatase PAP2 family protein [Thermodesulfobacteriota bacterium]
MWHGLERIDVWLFYLINRSGKSPLFDHLMPVASNAELFLIPLAISWCVLVTRKGIRWKSVAVAMILVISLSEWISSGVLKPTFDRPRPYHAVSEVHCYDRMYETWRITPPLDVPIRGQSFSLPSSHATNMFAAATFLSYYFPKGLPFFYVMALLVGYSRVYLGVHFPLDVLVGAVVGALCAVFGIAITNRVILLFESRGDTKSQGS